MRDTQQGYENNDRSQKEDELLNNPYLHIPGNYFQAYLYGLYYFYSRPFINSSKEIPKALAIPAIV